MLRVTSGCRGYAVVMAARSVVAVRTIKSSADAAPEKEYYSEAKWKETGGASSQAWNYAKKSGEIERRA